MPDLDQHLVAARESLLDDIRQPDLSQVSRRATHLRRRRRAGQAGAALLVVVAVGALVARPWAGPSATPQPAATPAPTPTDGPVYADSGITVNPLRRPAAKLPGDLTDVEFTDPDHGWALGTDCTGRPPCRLTLGTTVDGGLTWTSRSIPGTGGDLVALGPETLVVHGSPSWLSTDGGVSWRLASVGVGPAVLGDDARPLLRRGGGAACAGTVVEVWSDRYGYRGDLANPPPLDVCWAAATRAATGGWWVGGTAGGRPAVAVTYDRGVHWDRTVFDEPGTGARVASLGDQTTVAIVDGERLRALYRGIGRGPLNRTWAGPPEQTIGGEPVPLLDGRLLLVDGKDHWYVTDVGATALTETTREALPRVSRLWRTPAGYVAFDIVARGYAAFSSDGSTWRKLHVH